MVLVVDLNHGRAPVGGRAWPAALVFGIVVALVYHVSIPGDTAYNQYQLLAEAFLHGRLDLVDPPPHLETVPFGGRRYVLPPPLPALLLVPLVAVFGDRDLQGPLAAASGGAGAMLAFLVAARLVPRRRDQWWLAVLFAFGTTLWHLAAVGSVWYTAHVIAAAAVSAALLEALGRRRPAVIGAALAAAFWTRLPTVLTLPCFLLMTVDLWAPDGFRRVKTWRVGYLNALAAPLAGVMLLNFGYNWLRFGTIADVAERLGVDLQSGLFAQGVFSLSYIPRHLGVLFRELPRIEPVFPYVTWSLAGLALWITTPAFLLALRAPLRSLSTWAAWGGIVPGLLMVMTFGNTGLAQFGYRFAADFYPLVFFLTIRGTGGSLRPLHKALIVLSVLVNAWGVIWERMGWPVL